MKTFVLICFLFVVVPVSWAAEREFLYGEIIDLNRHSMVMTVHLVSDIEYAGGRDITVRLPAEMVHISTTGQERLPGCLLPGNHVRIWGVASSSASDSFHADTVRGCGMAACNDPTGVRSRLFQERNRESKEFTCR
jgi:hypothetical protein